MLFVLRPPEWWSRLTRPAGMRMPQASELSPDFPPESVRGGCHISQIRAWLPQSRNPNPTVARVESWTLLSSKPEGVVHRFCAAHTSLRGWSSKIFTHGCDTCKCAWSDCSLG